MSLKGRRQIYWFSNIITKLIAAPLDVFGLLSYHFPNSSEYLIHYEITVLQQNMGWLWLNMPLWEFCFVCWVSMKEAQAARIIEVLIYLNWISEVVIMFFIPAIWSQRRLRLFTWLTNSMLAIEQGSRKQHLLKLILLVFGKVY